MKKSILTFVLFLFSLIAFSQPDELYRGRHFIAGGTYGHPYTTFDRNNGDSSFIATINKIRQKILNEKPSGNVFQAYREIVLNAKGTRPKDLGLITYVKVDGHDKANGPSELAVWAKNNAFLFLIGLDENANWMDTTTYGGIKSNAYRDSFRDRVYMDDYPNNASMTERNAFMHFTDYVHISKDEVQFSARSTIFWLQAYDLLKAAYEIPELRSQNRNPFGFGDADREQYANEARSILKNIEVKG